MPDVGRGDAGDQILRPRATADQTHGWRASDAGATNLLTGIASAYVGHSPVVAIAGGPPFGHYYKDAFQELDLLSMFKPVTKLAIQVNKPERIPEILHYALRSAMTGRKGPVFIDI